MMVSIFGRDNRLSSGSSKSRRSRYGEAEVAKKVRAIVKLQIQGGRLPLRLPSALPWASTALTSWSSASRTMRRPKTRPDRGARGDHHLRETGRSPSSARPRRPPFLISMINGVAKGASKHRKEKIGKITQEQLRTIAETKLPDLNANDVEAAMRTLAGTARSMGITVEE